MFYQNLFWKKACLKKSKLLKVLGFLKKNGFWFKKTVLDRISDYERKGGVLVLDIKMWEKFESNLPVCRLERRQLPECRLLLQN